MLSALSAEALKLRRHRSTWLLVWIFPIGLTILMLLAMAIEGGGTPAPAAPEVDTWIRNAAGFWYAPPHGMARYLICAFVAVVFGGEYGWNTWKLIVPHRSRATLIASKYVVVLLLLYIAFILAAAIMNLLTYVDDMISGDPIPEGISAGALLSAHGWGFLAGLPAVLLTVAYTSLAAILTRSTTAALIIGVAITTLEGVFTSFGPMLGFYAPNLVEFFYQVLPGYHVVNLQEWALSGKAQEVPLPSGTLIAWNWSASLAVVAAWTIGMIALTFVRFGRQDLN